MIAGSEKDGTLFQPFATSRLNHKIQALRLIERQGPLSQKFIAKALHIKPPAACRYFRDLSNEGLITETGKASVSKNGRPVELWDINKTGNYSLGICFVPPMLLMGMSNFGQTLICNEQHDLTDVTSTHIIAQLIDRFIAKAKKYVESQEGILCSIFVGMPGHIDNETGIVFKCANMPILVGWDVEKHLMENHHIFCHNNKHDYAFYWGELTHISTEATLTVIDWDLGLGHVTGRGEKIYTIPADTRHPQEGIGEIAHMTVHKGGRPCHCGKTGCLEAYTGGWAIMEQLNRPDIQKLSDVIALAEAGDTQVLEELANALRILGENISWTVQFMGTEKIVFTGPLSAVFPRVKFAFLEGLAKYLDDDYVRSLNASVSLDPIHNLIRGACHTAKNIFFYPDHYIHQYRYSKIHK